MDYLPKNIEKSIKSFEYEFDKNIMLENFGEINYVVDDNLKDKIVINIEYYKDFNNIDVNIVDNYYYLENYELTDTYLNYVNIILDGLRSKTFYNWELLNDNTVKITTSAKNIDKLKNNLSEKEQKELEIKELEKYYDEKINEIYNDSSKLEDKILELEESNYVLEQEKEDLQIKLEEYKDKVKSIIE